jgi:HEAT repeat protein
VHQTTMGLFQTKPTRMEYIQQGLLHSNYDVSTASLRLARQHVTTLTPFLLHEISTQSDASKGYSAGRMLGELIPKGDSVVVNRLLELVNQDNPYAITPLGALANKGDQRVIDALVRICKKSETYDYHAIEALSAVASGSNDESAIKMLIHTLSTATRGGSGQSDCASKALMSVCSPGNAYVVNELCKLPLNDSISGTTFCRTLLHIANKGDEKVLNLLLDHLDKVSSMADKVIQFADEKEKQRLKDLFLYMTENADSEKKYAAFTMLVELCHKGDRTVIQHLHKSVKLTKEPFLGSPAICALGKLGDPHDENLITDLCKIATDMSLIYSERRTSAMSALGSLLGDNKRTSTFVSYTGPFFEDVSFVHTGECTLNLHDSLNVKLSRKNVGIHYSVCKVLIDCITQRNPRNGDSEGSNAIDSLLTITSVGDPIIICDLIKKYEQSGDSKVLTALLRFADRGNTELRNLCYNTLSVKQVSIEDATEHLWILQAVTTPDDEQVFNLAKKLLFKHLEEILQAQSRLRMGSNDAAQFLWVALDLMAVFNTKTAEVLRIIISLIEQGVHLFGKAIFRLPLAIENLYHPSDLSTELNTTKNEQVRDYLIDRLINSLARGDTVIIDEKLANKLLYIDSFEAHFLAVIGTKSD